MTAMALLVCCGWAVLLYPSVQAYGNIHICLLMSLIPVLGINDCIKDENEEISVKGAQ